MLAVLSPAKSLDFDSLAPTATYTQPELLSHSEELISRARELSADEFGKLTSVSDKLAELNVKRFADFQTPFTPENAKQAIYAFTGDVYTGFDASQLDKKALDYAQNHIRILSGLYGLLKPLDLMQAYRLEMGTRLSNQRGKNLYEFWGETITDKLNETLSNDDGVLVNLASKEYFSAVKPKALNGQIINVDFKEYRGDKWKIISFSAKKARGLMARYMATNQISKIDELRQFDLDGYQLNDDLSTDNHFVFTRNPQ
jgi:cytoplasmic iron level regulating protein YaaA (DUF328/UPF0246 family)